MGTNITEQQHQKLIQYLEDARGKHMNLLYISIAGSVLLFFPGMSLLSGFGNLYSTLAGVLWIVCVIGLVVLLATGYQKYFGGNSAYACAKRRAYSCAAITVGNVSGSEGRPPYLLNDAMGNQYISPIYMEFKTFRSGGSAIGVTLVNGMRYVFAEPNTSGY